MRFSDVETVTFTDKDGNRIPVKDIRPVSVFRTAQTVRVEKGVDLDELVSRSDFYGAENEGLAWAVADHNIEQFVESDFDMSRIKELKIPVIEEL